MIRIYPVPRAPLRALVPLAPTADIRGYLNGILFECQADGAARLVATDGHCLGVFRLQLHRADDEQYEPCSIIIPISTVKKIKDDRALSVVLLEAPPEGRTRFWAVEEGLAFDPVDGKFPDYVHVIPRKVSGVYSHTSPELLHRFYLVAKALGHKRDGGGVRFGFDRQGTDPSGRTVSGPALVEIQDEPDFCGVVMPLRTDATETPSAAPNWTADRLKCAAQPV